VGANHRNSMPTVPTARELLPEVTVTGQGGRQVRPSSLRPRRNLILVLLCGGSDKARALLSELADASADIEQEEGRVVAVLHGSPEQAEMLLADLKLPFLLFADPDGSVHRRFGALGDDGFSGPAVYITDRFGEIYSTHHVRNGDALPSAVEILASIRHINSACDE